MQIFVDSGYVKLNAAGKQSMHLRIREMSVYKQKVQATRYTFHCFFDIFYKDHHVRKRPTLDIEFVIKRLNVIG